MTTKGNDERCLLLVVSNRDPEHLFRPMALRIGDREPDRCGINRQCLGMAEVKENVKCLGQGKSTRRPRERVVRQDPIAYLFDLCQHFSRPILALDDRSGTREFHAGGYRGELTVGGANHRDIEHE